MEVWRAEKIGSRSKSVSFPIADRNAFYCLSPSSQASYREFRLLRSWTKHNLALIPARNCFAFLKTIRFPADAIDFAFFEGELPSGTSADWFDCSFVSSAAVAGPSGLIKTRRSPEIGRTFTECVQRFFSLFGQHSPNAATHPTCPELSNPHFFVRNERAFASILSISPILSAVSSNFTRLLSNATLRTFSPRSRIYAVPPSSGSSSSEHLPIQQATF